MRNMFVGLFAASLLVQAQEFPSGAVTSGVTYGRPLDEITLGLGERRMVLARRPPLVEPHANDIATRVLRLLLGNATLPALPYSVTILQDETVNAFSGAGGQIYINRGLASLLGDDVGLWAAVISHDAAHVVAQHHYGAYLRAWNQEQVKYYRAMAALGDEAAQWTLCGLSLRKGSVSKKVLRDNESEADRLGLMMLAHAGVHPDFAMLLHWRLKQKAGGESHVTPLFSSGHVHWAPPDQRTLEAYEHALRVFQSKWRDASASPGGAPPAVAHVIRVAAR